jgi:Cu/Ag efflux pump CusA
MTAGTMFIGAIPFVIGRDYGCEARESIGVTLTGGLLFGTIFVLIVFPALCAWVKEARRKISRIHS